MFLLTVYCLHTIVKFKNFKLIHPKLGTIVSVQVNEFWQMYTPKSPPLKREITFFITLENPFIILCNQSLNSQPNKTTNLLPAPLDLVFPVLECHVHRVVRYVTFCVWLLSLSILFLRASHVVVLAVHSF